MKIIENLLVLVLIFLPATIWWIKNSYNQFNLMKSWADGLACFIMWGITIGVACSMIIFGILILTGGSFTFVF